MIWYILDKYGHTHSFSGYIDILLLCAIIFIQDIASLSSGVLRARGLFIRRVLQRQFTAEQRTGGAVIRVLIDLRQAGLRSVTAFLQRKNIMAEKLINHTASN